MADGMKRKVRKVRECQLDLVLAPVVDMQTFGETGLSECRRRDGTLASATDLILDQVTTVKDVGGLRRPRVATVEGAVLVLHKPHRPVFLDL